MQDSSSSSSLSSSSSSSSSALLPPTGRIISQPISTPLPLPSLSATPAAVEARAMGPFTDCAYNRNPTFHKKRNISGDGTLYERNFATLCFLRGNNRHEDFYLTAAVDALHPFDDVQFETRDPKSLRSSVVQLKHKHGKSVTYEALRGSKGDMSRRRWRDKSFIIRQFHAGFCKIRDMAEEIQEQFGFINRFPNLEFILYTNCAVEENGTGDIWDAITPAGCGNRDIATSEECSIHGKGCFFLKDTHIPWQCFSPDFLDRFRLYAGQAGENDMEQLIHNEISANKAAWGEDPSEVVAYNLCNFIEKWLTKETLPLDASIKDKFLKKLQVKKNSNEYVPWFPLD